MANINISGQLHSTVEIAGDELHSHVVASTGEILDEGLEKKQVDVNDDFDSRIMDLESGSVSYNEQTPTQAEQEQARENLGVYSKERVDQIATAFTEQKYVSVKAVTTTTSSNVAALINATGQGEQTDTIYRVGSFDGSAYDAEKYTEYTWNGSAYVIMAVRSSQGDAGGAFDISAYNAVDGVSKVYDNLTLALADVPQKVQRPGMSAMFIQNIPAMYSVAVTETDTQPTGTAISSASSVTSGTYEAADLTDFSTLPSATGSANAVVYYYENSSTFTVWTITMASAQGSEYVQYRLMAAVWSNTPADWQGVDTEPTAGSRNLVESGGASDMFAERAVSAKDILTEDDLLVDLTEDFDVWSSGVILANGNFVPGHNGHTSGYIEVSSADVLYVKCARAVSAPNPNVAAYDSAMKYIGALFAGGSTDSYATVPIDSKTRYVRLVTVGGDYKEFYKATINDSLFKRIHSILNKQEYASLYGYVKSDGAYVKGNSSSEYICTDFISVSSGDIVFSNCISTGIVRGLVLYDAEKNVIPNEAVSGINAYKVEDNVSFVRLSLLASNHFVDIVNSGSGKYFPPSDLADLLQKLYSEKTLLLTEGGKITVGGSLASLSNNIVTFSGVSTGNSYFSITPLQASVKGHSYVGVVKVKCLSIDGADSCSLKRSPLNSKEHYDGIMIGDEVTLLPSITVGGSYAYYFPNAISSWEIVDFVAVWIPDDLYTEVFIPFAINPSYRVPLRLWNVIDNYRKYNLTPFVADYAVIAKEAYRLGNMNYYLSGKSYCAFGTSITAYAPAADDMQSVGVPYPSRVGGYFNMKVVNFGKGSSVCHGENGNIRTDLLSQMPADTMLVSMLNGANGWITDNIDSTDTSTSVGAYNVAISYIKDNYPGAVIVIGADAPFETVINDMEAIAKKNHVLLAHSDTIPRLYPFRDTDGGLHLTVFGTFAMASTVIEAAKRTMLQTIVAADVYSTVTW